VPRPSVPEQPSLYILTDNAGEKAKHMAVGEMLDNTFVTPSNLSDISCSFVGGCQFEIPASGITTNVLGGSQKVSVCGNEAILVSSASDSTKAIFEVPELKTSASESAANREASILLTPRNDFASKSSMEGVLFDGLNVPGMLATGNNCFVGVKYGTYKSGILSEVRFFMDYFADNFDLYN
jgi:hypothetical protein